MSIHRKVSSTCLVSWFWGIWLSAAAGPPWSPRTFSPSVAPWDLWNIYGRLSINSVNRCLVHCVLYQMTWRAPPRTSVRQCAVTGRGAPTSPTLCWSSDGCQQVTVTRVRASTYIYTCLDPCVRVLRAVLYVWCFFFSPKTIDRSRFWFRAAVFPILKSFSLLSQRGRE